MTKYYVQGQKLKVIGNREDYHGFSINAVVQVVNCGQFGNKTYYQVRGIDRDTGNMIEQRLYEEDLEELDEITADEWEDFWKCTRGIN